jgi:hypothetical protein
MRIRIIVTTIIRLVINRSFCEINDVIFDTNKQFIFTHHLIELLSKNEEECEKLRKEFYDVIQKEAIEQALIGLASGFDARLKELEVNANTFKSRIAQYRADLVATSARLDQTMKDILNFDLEGEKDTIRKELVNIATHKKVDHITYESGFLCIYTVPLYLFEPIKKERFYLGKMVIKINTSNGSIRFDNLDNRRNGYWHNSPHPHVDDGGCGCLGNIDGQVADAFTRKQYYVLFITLLGYLETCNINDCAGARVHAWDMVDKNGKIITEGDEDCDDDEYDEYPTCTICGEEIEGEVIYCEDCDAQMHEECAIYINELDEWHCPTCAREHHDVDV